MARSPRKKQRQPELPDLLSRQAGRFPWDGFSPEQMQELSAAHERARCLRANGHGAVIWGESTSGEIFNDF